MELPLNYILKISISEDLKIKIDSRQKNDTLING